MSTRQFELLLDEVTRVAAQLGDPALLEDCKRIILPAQTYRAENFKEHDPLGLVRDAWKSYASAVGQTLDQLGAVFVGTIADMRNVRAAIVSVLREIDAAESARLESMAMDFKGSPGRQENGVLGNMQRQAAHISGQLQQFSRIAQVVPLLNRAIGIEREIEELTQQFGNPHRRLRISLMAIRSLRVLHFAIRGAINAGVYVGVFALSYYFDDSVKEFVAGLVAGELANYVKLFGVMLLIELVKGKIVEAVVEKRLRRWEACATGTEMESLSELAVKTRVLIAKMKAELSR